jgi:hypothetical protein
MNSEAGNYLASATEDDGSCADIVVINMADSYGDGWNADTSLFVAGVEYWIPGTSGPTPEGSGLVVEAEVPVGSCVQWNYTGSTLSWASEMSFSVTLNGAGIGSSGGGDASAGYSADTCAAGCTNPDADNYDSTAEVDDGSCIGGVAEVCEIDTLTGPTCSTSYICDGTSATGTASWGPDCSDGSDEQIGYCCLNGLGPYAGAGLCTFDMMATPESNSCPTTTLNSCGTSYLCDGTSATGTASWGPDCSDGSDEVIEFCCAADLGPYGAAGLCD